MPIITDGGSLSVVLGVGDLRITTIEDLETGCHMLVFAQGDKSMPIGGPGMMPSATQEERWDYLRTYPPSLILGSVSRAGIDNLIRILQEVREQWTGPDTFTPPDGGGKALGCDLVAETKKEAPGETASPLDRGAQGSYCE